MASQSASPYDAVLIGYENQENLGLRSLLAYLKTRGFRCCLVPFSPPYWERTLAGVLACRPQLVGVSVIFQNSIEEFASLLRHLRAQGLNAHFTAGGHFPSLRPRDTFDLLPELDSIVRFEGELTLAELMKHLAAPQRWDAIAGLAFRRGSQIVVTPLRPLVQDLDTLPLVERGECKEVGRGIRTAAMLASRGCLYNCSFCSVRQFYGASDGPLRRVRSPRHVAGEMEHLYREHGVRFFSFLDDDFAMRTAIQRDWLRQFLGALAAAGIATEIRWKISCRVDDLDPALLDQMIASGLIGVELGVESGSDRDLRRMDKRATARQNLDAVNLLKKKNLGIAMGFMMLDPWSTLTSLGDNIAFLEAVGADGDLSINFGKMLPFAGTPVEAELLREGRLMGSAAHPDYTFDDPKIRTFEYLMGRIFARRNFAKDGLAALLQEADFTFRLESSLGYAGPPSFGARLREIVRQSNELAVSTLKSLHEAVSWWDKSGRFDESCAVTLAEREWKGEALLELRWKEMEMDLAVARVLDAPGRDSVMSAL